MKKLLLITFLIPSLVCLPVLGGDINFTSSSPGATGKVTIQGGSSSGGGTTTVSATSNVLQFSSTNTASVGGTVSERSLIGLGVGTLTFPAGVLVNGYTFRVQAKGTWEGAEPIQFRLKLGGVTIGDSVGPDTMTGGGMWSFDSLITIRAEGASGSLSAQSYFFPDTSGSTTIFDLSNLSTSSVNTTIANTLDLTAQWSTDVATITCTNFLIDALAVSTNAINISVTGSSPLEVFSNFDQARTSPTASISIGDALKLSVSGSTAVLTVDFSSVASRSDIVAGSGGGGRPLEVFSNFDGVRSSPTFSIGGGDSLVFSVSGSTVNFSVDFTSVPSRSDAILNQNTLQSGSNFYVSSGTSLNYFRAGLESVRPAMTFDASNAGGNAQLNLYNGLASPGVTVIGRASSGGVDWLYGDTAASFILSLSTNSGGNGSAFTRMQFNKAAPGDIFFFDGTGTQMAQFTTSSSTLSGQVSIGTLKFPDGTVQVTSATTPTVFSIYPATNTIVVPFGISASTAIFTSSVTADSLRNTDGTSAIPDKEYWWPGAATLPTEANDSIPPVGLTAGTNFDLLTTDFDSATPECRSVNFFISTSSLVGVSTVTFVNYWYSQSATTNNVGWYFKHNNGATAGEKPDASFQAHYSSFDAVQPSTRTFTITEWDVSLASLTWRGGDVVDGNICRNANNASDNMSGDAKMEGFGIRFKRR